MTDDEQSDPLASLDCTHTPGRRCGSCWEGWPRPCEHDGCDGMEHAEFGDYSSYDSYWLARACDRGGLHE